MEHLSDGCPLTRGGFLRGPLQGYLQVLHSDGNQTDGGDRCRLVPSLAPAITWGVFRMELMRPLSHLTSSVLPTPDKVLPPRSMSFECLQTVTSLGRPSWTTPPLLNAISSSSLSIRARCCGTLQVQGEPRGLSSVCARHVSLQESRGAC